MNMTADENAAPFGATFSCAGLIRLYRSVVFKL